MREGGNAPSLSFADWPWTGATTRIYDILHPSHFSLTNGRPQPAPKISQNIFKKPLDKYLNLWYNNNVPKRYSKNPRKKKLKKSKKCLTNGCKCGIIRMYPRGNNKF